MWRKGVERWKIHENRKFVSNSINNAHILWKICVFLTRFIIFIRVNKVWGMLNTRISEIATQICKYDVHKNLYTHLFRASSSLQLPPSNSLLTPPAIPKTFPVSWNYLCCSWNCKNHRLEIKIIDWRIFLRKFFLQIFDRRLYRSLLVSLSFLRNFTFKETSLHFFRKNRSRPFEKFKLAKLDCFTFLSNNDVL